MEKLWGRRFLALIIDIFVVSLIIWILSSLIYPLIAIVGLYDVFNLWLVFVAIIILLYFTYLEGRYGTTLGKSILKIEVITDEGKVTYKKALIRSLSKILWVPLIVDVLVGFVAGNSKIRYLDRVAGTNVVHIISKNENKNKLKSMTQD